MFVKILHIIVPCAIILVTAYHGPDLPPGPYCGKTGECCQQRQDSCSHRILDTLCYCDEHCNRTIDDCCPDYEEVCLGIAPPRPTPAPEPQIKLNCNPGAKKAIGCNECVCDPTGLEWRCEQEECMINEEIIALVNQGSSWIAGNYSDFAGKKLKDGMIYKLGTLPLNAYTERMNPIHYNKQVNYPQHFDSRARWPEFISPVVDQGWCGADWAVTIAAITSDRFAIQSNGAESLMLSPQTLLSCNERGQQGCEGGNIDVAWHFVGTHGLVDEDCFPYRGTKTHCPFKPRADLIQDGCQPMVAERTARYTVGPPIRLDREEDIMFEIKESGPVHAIMTVYQDFFHYRGGVYRRSPFGNERLHGLHSVRIVGWGEDRGDKYWIVANTWGSHWGENGYFRIARGTNESGIESFVIAALSDVYEA